MSLGPVVLVIVALAACAIGALLIAAIVKGSQI